MIYVLLLVLVTAVWGWTFVLVKDAVTQYPTLSFLQARFLLALLVMAVLVYRLPSRRELRLGAVIGVVLAAGYLTQTAGLTMTSPGNAGLITGLRVRARFLHPDALVLVAIVGHELASLKFEVDEPSPP